MTLSETQRYVKNSRGVWILVALLAFENLIVPIAQSEMLILISTQNQGLVKWFLGLEFFDYALSSIIIQPLILSTANRVLTQFKIDGIQRYRTMTFDSCLFWTKAPALCS